MSNESADFYALVYRRGERVFCLDWCPMELHLHRESDRTPHDKIADWAKEIGDSLENCVERLPMGMSSVIVHLWSSRGYEGDYDMGEELCAVVPLPDPEWSHTRDTLRTTFEEQRRAHRRAESEAIDRWDAAAALGL